MVWFAPLEHEIWFHIAAGPVWLPRQSNVAADPMCEIGHVPAAAETVRCVLTAKSGQLHQAARLSLSGCWIG